MAKLTLETMKLSGPVHSMVLRALREFGYPKLTLESVEQSCDRVQAGKDSDKSVIDVLVKKILQDACDAKNGE